MIGSNLETFEEWMWEEEWVKCNHTNACSIHEYTAKALVILENC